MSTKPEEETASQEDADRDTESRSPATEDSEGSAHPERPEGSASPEESAGSESSTEAQPGDSAEGAGANRSPRRRPGASPLLAAAIVLLVIAASCTGGFGWSWYTAAHDNSLSYSRMRDEALGAGEQAIKNLNTLDYRTVKQDLNVWLSSSTGELHNEIAQGREQFVQRIRRARTITTAKILDSALTELNERAGKASIIVALRITVTPPEGKPITKRSRLEGELTRTDSGWKLSSAGQVPVGTSVPGSVASTTPTPGQ